MSEKRCYEHLKRLASKATSGVWEALLGASGVIDIHLKDSQNEAIIHWVGFDSAHFPDRQCRANAEYIEAVQPYKVALMIGNIEDLEKQLKAQQEVIDKYEPVVTAAKILSKSDTWDVANSDEWNNLDKAINSIGVDSEKA